MKVKTTYVIPILILASGLIVMVILFGLKSDDSVRTPRTRAMVVEAIVVEPGKMSADITAFGRLQSAQPVQLFSEVTGMVQGGNVQFQPATRFRKGDVLVRIDDRQIRLDISSAKSDLLTALASVLPEIQLDFPEEFDTWERYFDACGFDSDIPDLPEVTNRKIKLFLARFNVYKLFFAIRNLEIFLEKHSIRAPFSGSIVAADVRKGSTVRPGGRLGEIISLQDMEVEIPVPSSDAAWMDRNSPVQLVSTEVEGNWSGRISRVSGTVNAQTQALSVFIKLVSGPLDKLYDGVLLTATIRGREIDNAVSVPRRALYRESYVYVVDDGRLATRDVRVLRKQAQSSIIDASGLEGDTLIVEVLQGVAPGLAIRPQIVTE